MKRHAFLLFTFLIILIASASPAQTAQSEAWIAVGDEAPDFTLSDSSGKTYKLSDFRGEKPVVLEFFRSGGW